MIENIKKISNPLTIIAIFAGLAEIAGTVAIKLVDVQYQGTFIWFVMIFPILLVLLFFIVLYFKPHSLYAPADFRTDESYIDINKRWTELLRNGNIVKQPLLEPTKTKNEKQKIDINHISLEGKKILLAIGNKHLTAQEQVDETYEILTKDERFSILKTTLNETQGQAFAMAYFIGFINNIQILDIINKKEAENKFCLTVPQEAIQQIHEKLNPKPESKT